MAEDRRLLFEAQVGEVFSFLSAYGFTRNDQLSSSTGMYCSVAYTGRFVGFDFVHDFREQAVDLNIFFDHPSGWPAALLDDQRLSTFLDERGYRGGRAPVIDRPCCRSGERGDLIRAALCGWSDLLLGPGKLLLEDNPDSVRQIRFGSGSAPYLP